MQKTNLQEFKIVIKARTETGRALLSEPNLLIEVTGKDPHTVLKMVERLLKTLIVTMRLHAEAQVIT